jgi:N6-adenosine-specific RNA methylase IME4
MSTIQSTIDSLREFGSLYPDGFGTVLIDPPWRFINRTGKVAPEHKRLARYETLSTDDLAKLPVGELAKNPSHIYLWCPNALLPDGLRLLDAWGFKYKTNLIWYKIRKDGGPDGRGVGFYFRNVTEMVLFGVKGSMRTLSPGRRQVNLMAHRKREHSKKPPTLHQIAEECSPGQRVELFSRERLPEWEHWGNQVDTYEETRPHHKGYEWTVSDVK